MEASQPAVAAPVEAEASGPSPGWSVARRFGFRFLFAFAVLSILPWPFSAILPESWITKGHERLVSAGAVWLGRHVLGITRPIPVEPNGSGDRTVDYLGVLAMLAIAAVAAGVWSVVDRRRTAHRRLQAWLHLVVRYWLGMILVHYGFGKIFEAQFPAPPPFRYVQPLGDYSPMGLLWTFMGSSRPYSVFGGVAEALAGSLLFVRRTSTLGALLGGAVMANIVMLNLCYDVPVKLWSMLLLLACLFVAGPDLRRLAHFFVFNRPAVAAELRPTLTSPWGRKLLFAAQVLLVGWALYASLGYSLLRNRQRATPHPLHGVYDVEVLERNGRKVEPLFTDATVWRRVSFFGWGCRVTHADDSIRRFGIIYDDANHRVILEEDYASEKNSVLSVTHPDPDHVVLQGRLGPDDIRAVLERKDLSSFLLLNRGFRWINEEPFNR